MKKIIAVILALTLCLGAATFAACSDSTNGDKTTIVCTIFPQYDWVRQIIGDNDNYELVLLLENGVDLHNYTPSAKDLATIASSDMFIYTGGESDEWVDGALANKVNENLVAVNLLDVLSDAVLEEDHDISGTGDDHVHEDEEDHDHAAEEEHSHYDEHVWLSLKNAKTLTNFLASELGKLDPDNAEKYTQNATAYGTELDKLDASYADMVSKAKFDTIVCADRFPFRYLVNDYGINYFAAFSGCSAETEASVEVITSLASKIDEYSLTSILTTESSDNKIANQVKQATTAKNQTIRAMNSLQSVTTKDIERGITYLLAMQSNLEVLTAALN